MVGLIGEGFNGISRGGGLPVNLKNIRLSNNSNIDFMFGKLEKCDEVSLVLCYFIIFCC